MTMYALNDTDPQSLVAGVSFWRGIEIHFDHASGTYPICTVPVGSFVLDVIAVVKEVFDGAPTLTAGDGDDVDGFLISADIAPGTALTVTAPAVARSSNTDLTTAAYNGAKYYPTGDTVDVVWTKAAAGTTGSMIVLALILQTQKMGLPAGLASTSVPI